MAEAIDSNRLEKWFSFTQKLYSTLDLDQAGRVAIDVALQLTGMDRGILLTQDDGNSFRFRHAQNREGRTLSEEQFSSVVPLIERACLKTSPHQELSKVDGVKTVLSIPVLCNRWSESTNKVVGILYCDSSREIPRTETAQEMLDLFVMHAGPALESVILYDWATRDPKTGVYQRHYFDAMAQTEWRRTLRHKHPLAVLKLDLDNLRQYNERHGRAAGDKVLSKTAEILKEICRTEDLIARYEIDEFAVLLPETDSAGARLVAGRIVEEVPLLLTRDPDQPVTISIGGALYPRCAVNNIVDLIKLAEIALQHAKQAGGGRGILYEPALSSAHKKLF